VRAKKWQWYVRVVECSTYRIGFDASMVVLQDTTFEFERRRNVLAKYDRETMEATIKAMSRISEIQLRRQERFHQNRMKGKKAAQKLQVRCVFRFVCVGTV
jgi:hypothetical protein